MANYSQLAQFIDDRVYDNNDNAITGSSLNYVLNHMVEILGDGFLFNGVIDPESSISTPDTNIFYVGFAGTYGQFASQTYTVGLGEIGFFAYDGHWHVGIGRVGSGGGGGGDFDVNSLRLAISTTQALATDEVDVTIQYNAGTPESPNWINVTAAPCAINKADLYTAGVISRDDYRKLWADSRRTKTNEYYPYVDSSSHSPVSMGSKSFYAACIQELWLDPEVYGNRLEYQLEYAMISKFSIRKQTSLSQLECAFKIIYQGVPTDPVETIIDFSVTLPANPTAQTLVEVPTLIHNADYSCIAVINWNAVSNSMSGYEYTGDWHGQGPAPEQYRLTEEAAIFDLSYSPTIKQFLENRNNTSFEYEKLQLYLNLNMTNRNRQTVSLRYNVGTAQAPDYENLGNVAFELAETTGWAGLIDGYSYYYLRAKLQQTKPQNNFPLKADQNDNFKTHSRVIDELWINPTAYTPQQIQAMRVNRLLVNYDDNGDTVCEFRIIIPSNLSDLTQPWNVVIGYREVVTSSNRPSRVIFNASKTVWAVINWNNTLVEGGEYINHSDSEGVDCPFLDDTGKITDLNYAPTIQTCLDAANNFVGSAVIRNAEVMSVSQYSNLPSKDPNTVYLLKQDPQA